MRERGHNVVTTSKASDALELLRRHSFDALVMDFTKETTDILNFTTKACGLQPSLAVFLADDWGDELATGLEELSDVLRMLEDDELAMLKVESRTACQ